MSGLRIGVGVALVLLGLATCGGCYYAKQQLAQTQAYLASPEGRMELLKAELQQPGATAELADATGRLDTWASVAGWVGGALALGGIAGLVTGRKRTDHD